MQFPLADNFAPYAPVQNVMEFIKRKRERGLPNPVTSDTLEAIGIPKGNTSRTFQALKFLGLVDAENQQTAKLDRVARASSAEFQQVLAEAVKSAYGRVFTIVDPAQDDQTAVEDAFRQFEPAGQRRRMVTLFMSLCDEAGLVDSQRLLSPPRKSERRRTKGQQQVRPKVQENPVNQDNTVPSEGAVASSGIDYRLISAVINQLPSDGHWTSSRRERWFAAITTVVDLMVEVHGDPDEPNEVP